jgi:antitoxin Phd
MQTWPIQEARDKLATLVEEAAQHGPQVLTQDGTEVAVLLSVDEYRRLTEARPPLSQFFRGSPLAEVELDLSRKRDPIPPAGDL